MARYPLGLRLPAGPFLSMPAPAAAGKIVLEENKHGQQSDGTPSEAQVPCSKQNESTLRAVAGGGGSWVSRAQYPGALAAPTRSPVSAPAPIPEPAGTGARSRRHVPHHLENEQVEREQKPLHLRAVAGGVVFSGLSGSVPSERGRVRCTCVPH